MLRLKRDENLNAIPVGKTFITQVVTLSGTAYNEVTKPENAVEIHTAKSDSDFTLGENDEATGFTADEMDSVGIANMSSVWLKGSDEQEINILWTVL